MSFGITQETADSKSTKKMVRMTAVIFGLTFITTVLAILSFYWFSYRPFQIRKQCYEQSKGYLVQSSGGRLTSPSYNEKYEACLNQHGY